MSEKALQALIVDDSRTDAKILAALLSGKLHCEVETALNGLDGLDKLSTLHFDIVFLDLVMPVMGGVEVLEEIRGSATTTDIPVVVLSADSEADTVRSVLQFNIFDYIVKPINGAELVPRFTEKLNSLRSFLGVSGSPLIPQDDSFGAKNREVLLIIDADVNFRRFCANAVGDRFQVVAAANGAQAIAAAAKTPPRYILAGARLGVFDRTRMVAKLRSLPAVAHSRIYTVMSDTRSGSDCGAGLDGTLKWTFQPNLFRAELERLIEKTDGVAPSHKSVPKGAET